MKLNEARLTGETLVMSAGVLVLGMVGAAAGWALDILVHRHRPV